jgi:PAS domain S-box-containing protein
LHEDFGYKGKRILAQVTDGSLHQGRNESEERYRTLFDTLIEGFCTIEMIFDAAGEPIDYRFLEINPAFERQTGLIDAQGKSMRELAPNHEAHWFEIYGKVALTGEAVHFENEAKALGRVYDVCAYRVGGPGSKKVAILFNDISARKHAEEKVLAQLARLALLNQITHAIGERQDLPSIFQVVVGTLEEKMPVDFGCICMLDALDAVLTVTCVGVRSAALAAELGMPEHARIAVDTNGLGRCASGELVYEPDIADLHFPFTEKLAGAGLRALVAAPLQVESRVFGMLIAARRAPRAAQLQQRRVRISAAVERARRARGTSRGNARRLAAGIPRFTADATSCHAAGTPQGAG